MVKRRESLALLVVLVVVVGIPAALFGYQALRQRPTAGGVRIINIAARAPEQGGFSPDRIVLQVGETVKLRISAPDVLHGISIPGLGDAMKVGFETRDYSVVQVLIIMAALTYVLINLLVDIAYAYIDPRVRIR